MDIKLIFAADSPPLSVIAAAKVAGVSVSVNPSLPTGSIPSFVFSNGLKLHGAYVLLRYIGRVASHSNFYGKDPIESGQIDEWLDYLPILDKGSEFEAGCSYLDTYLVTNTFLVGNDVSIADICLWSALAGTGQRWDSLTKSNKKYQNLVRWYNSLSSEYSILHEVLGVSVGKRCPGKPTTGKFKDQDSQNQSKSAGADTNDKGKTHSRPEIDLPDAEIGKVCLRFAPEPSGYLHIGHSKAALLNKYFAERYKGRLIVRFDDTNPAKESNEFVENLLKDIETLGIVYDSVTYTSDYFSQLMEMAENLIHQGKAYVDDTPREQMQEERMHGIESKCRSNSVEKNLELWKEMIAASERGKMCCLRGKLDMQDPNKSLRDPVYYRCNPIPHHRIGSKYNLYPTYDFACPFVDSLEGITHALRSNEYHDRNAQYHRIQQDMGPRKVHIYEFSRLNMVYTLLSKRKLLWFVDNGKVDGWDDPRFPTVQGIVRRGLKIEALIQFILEQTIVATWINGLSETVSLVIRITRVRLHTSDPLTPHWREPPKRIFGAIRNNNYLAPSGVPPKWDLGKGASKNLNLMEWDKLWSINKRIIDPVCPRHTAVIEERRVMVTLIDGPEKPFTRIIPRHKKYEGAGEKCTTYTKNIWIEHADAEAIYANEEVTLMDWGNAIVKEIKKDDTGNVTQLIGVLNLEGSVKTTKLKLTWLPETDELVKLQLMEFDYLITKKKLEEDEEFRDVLNPVTKRETLAIGDTNMQNLQHGEVIQLERKGYFRCDVPFVRRSKPIVLFAIPDGRQQSALR